MIKEKIKEKVIESEREYLKAMLDGDVDKFDELINEEVQLNVPDGKTINKEMVLYAYKTKKIMVSKIRTIDLDIRVFNDVAIVNIVVELLGTFLEQPINGKYKFLRVWKESDKRWLLIGESSIIL